MTPLGFSINEYFRYLGHFANPAILAQGHNPLTDKGQKIYEAMLHTYGGDEKKAKKVFYASKNKGTIKGVD